MFKYFRVNEYSLSNLAESNLFLNHHSSFNDPFECRCEILSGFPSLEVESPRLINILNAWGFERADDEVVRESYDDYVESLESSEPDIEYYIDNARIGCFSKRQDNLLMWAHYADGLRGFCLEFDSQKLIPPDQDAKIYEVLYENEPAIIDASVMAVLHDQWDYHNDAFFEAQALAKYRGEGRNYELSLYEAGVKDASYRLGEIYQKMLATKPVQWSYEEELRLIDFAPRTGQSGTLMFYPESAIKSVIFGEKMTRDHQQLVQDILHAKALVVPIKKAVRGDGNFNIHIVDFK